MQMHRFSLKNFLAEEVLKKIYKPEDAEIEALQLTDFDETPTENVLKMYARAFQAEVNKKAAMIVLDSLTEDKRKLIKLKYGVGKQFVAISFILNLSVGQLMNWNQVILRKVARSMSFSLTSEDVFYKKKIAEMVALLEKNVEFFSLMSKEYKTVRQDWLEELNRRKNNYQRLLNRIERMEREGKKDSFTKVILTKFQNPNETLENIAEMCQLDKGSVSKYLKRFINSAREYLK